MGHVEQLGDNSRYVSVQLATILHWYLAVCSCIIFVVVLAI